MAEITMPTLGADMEQGTIVEWLVHPGDHIRRGDLIAVVDTDKADIEIESFVDGIVEQLLLDVGIAVPVGTPIATVGDEVGGVGGVGDVAAPTTAPPPTPAPPLPPPPVAAPPVGPPPVTTPPTPTHPAGGEPAPSHTLSPLLRRLAHHLGVDLELVVGSGPGGRVVRADIERAAGEPAPAAPVRAGPDSRPARSAAPASPTAPPPPASPTAPPAARAVASRDRDVSMRHAIAALMTRSAHDVPQYHVAHRIDLDAALQWLEETNLERPLPQRLVPAALLVKAVALAAAQIPELNGFWIDDGFRPADGVAVGLAVSLRGGGLLVPAIHDADQLPLDTVMAQIARPRRAGTRRAIAGHGAHRRRDHDHEPGRYGGRCRARTLDPAAGCAGGVRTDPRRGVGGRRDGRRPPRGPCQPRRRPPRIRRHPGGPLPEPGGPAPAGT